MYRDRKHIIICQGLGKGQRVMTGNVYEIFCGEVVIKGSKILFWSWSHNSVNILKIELYILSEQIL